MPVLSRCPLCRGIMPGSHGESRCPRCGELVLPLLRKLCAACGEDLTREKRVRDESGEYYCHDCWDAKLASRGEETGYLCNTCGRVLPSDLVYQDGEETVCKECFAHRGDDPRALLDAADDVGDDAPAIFTPTAPYRRPKETPWGLISLAIAILVGLGALILVATMR